MSDERTLPTNADANVEISVVDEHWHVFCHEPYCQREEGYPAFTYRQAQKWRTAHRKAHARGEVEASRTYWTAFDMARGCQCDWAGRECCPLHVNAEDAAMWEAMA